MQLSSASVAVGDVKGVAPDSTPYRDSAALPSSAPDVEQGVPVIHTSTNETGGIQVMQALPAQAIPAGMATAGTGTVLAGSTFVVDLGIEIQRGFRRKLLTILLLQLCLSLAVGLVIRYVVPLDSFLNIVFPAQSLQTLVLGLACVVGLPCLTYVRDYHPWNLVCTTLWTLAWGVFLAACHVPGGIVRSNALFVIFGTTCLGIAILVIHSHPPSDAR